jgi:hypothetical protein
MQTRICNGRCRASTMSDRRNVVLSADPSWINPVCPPTSYVFQISCYLRWVSFVLLLLMTGLFDVTASLRVTHVFCCTIKFGGKLSILLRPILFSSGAGRRSRYSDWLRAGRSVDGIPVGARFSAPVQTGPGAHPASYTMGTGYLQGEKRPKRGVDYPPPSSAEIKEKVELYLYSTSGPTWLVRGRSLPFIPFSMACLILLRSDTSKHNKQTSRQSLSRNRKCDQHKAPLSFINLGRKVDGSPTFLRSRPAACISLQ